MMAWQALVIGDHFKLTFGKKKLLLHHLPAFMLLKLKLSIYFICLSSRSDIYNLYI